MHNNEIKKRNNSVAVMLDFAINTLSQLILFHLFLLNLVISAIWLACKKPPFHMDGYHMDHYLLSGGGEGVTFFVAKIVHKL